jgi:thiol-disulfide isomerase/thioredoxin
LTESIEARAPEAQTGAPPGRRPSRGFIRRVIYPLAVIAAIAAVIWWLEYRDDGGAVSPRGERYGPVALPAALVPPAADVSPQKGDLAPDFLLERLEGGELRLSEFRGKAVVLNFWATWCAPCRKEIPLLIEAYDRYRDQGLVVIGLNLQEGKSIIEPYARDFGMEFPIAVDRDGEVGDEYRLLGLPTTYFIDREGVVRSTYTGPFQEKAGDTEVRGAIASGELQGRIEEILSPAGAEGR